MSVRDRGRPLQSLAGVLTCHQIASQSNVFGFTGHEMDAESGLIYAKARYYDPDTGRFLSHDPVEGMSDNPPSLHRYLYAYQNPTVWVDPTGRVAETKEFSEFQKDVSSDPEKMKEFLHDILGDRADGIDPALAAAILQRTAAGTDLVNLYLNAAITKSTMDQGGELPEDVREEMEALLTSFVSTYKSLDSMVTMVEESPLEAASQLGSFVKSRGKEGVDLLLAAVKGDERATFHLKKMLSGVGIDAAVAAMTGGFSRVMSGTGKFVELPGGKKAPGKKKSPSSQDNSTPRSETSSMGSEGAETAEVGFRSDSNEQIYSRGAIDNERGESYEAAAKEKFQRKIVRQNEEIRDASGRIQSEIDFETDEAIVEVGMTLGGKSSQLFRLAEVAKSRAKRLDILYDPVETPPKRLEELKRQLRGKYGNRVRFIPFMEEE